jgi:MYXO-CTERM domain-containing protein
MKKLSKLGATFMLTGLLFISSPTIAQTTDNTTGTTTTADTDTNDDTGKWGLAGLLGLLGLMGLRRKDHDDTRRTTNVNR